MEITVVGTGYVGLVTGTCFAETGNNVICVDCDRRKVDMLLRGEMPIYEPGLAELVKRNASAGRLRFTTDLAVAVRSSDMTFLAVGTPPAEDGSVDLAALWKVVEQIAPHLPRGATVVLKSTVPVGTNAAVTAKLKRLTGHQVEVASNPEFLKEGTAIDDFMKPDRVVVGARRDTVFEVFQDLYQPYLRTDKPLLRMIPESAELTKYVANALLSTKISFINEVANLCERTGADVNDVRRGIGHDERIGFAFLFPGVGYGGSCFPKDVRALAATARACGMNPRILESVHEVNEAQKSVLVEKIERHFADQLAQKTVAVWGAAFKPGTDDIREAPSLVLIDWLLSRDANVRIYDPVALGNIRRRYGDKLVLCDDCYHALEGADALAILTEWKQFVHPDFEQIRTRMNAPVIFDGRNLYSPERMQDGGFTYYSIGRRAVHARQIHKVVA
jgi:UDPglucose 6-dehydrogenase